MTAAEIRDSFLSFFRRKGHSVVPSASLMPTSPNLLFTNAGMNQFVPYFLGTQKAPYHPPRAADTQKCIRAGGKHNDLEDVGLDTYHHTFFEMLGNWSFGDYFKQDAINWAWELVVDTWGFPPSRLYATVYAPGESDPAEFDQEAYDHWKALFLKAGLDPETHIVNGNKEDNFWMMGDTGPCGPCSELHVDLTPDGDTNGALVNQDDARCIEIWNLVFIQLNAEPDGSYRDLPAKHVDTGMGFERACAIIQGTKNFTDFSNLPSNYDTDVFTPIFQKLEQLSGKKYTRTLPAPGSTDHSTAEKSDVAFRVIADHIRTLSFSIADGILPGNTDRNYVLRRILRRAVRYGRNLGLGEDGSNFLPQLVPVLVDEMAPAFPELKQQQSRITETLDTEESAFNKTLDRGISLFNREAERLGNTRVSRVDSGVPPESSEPPSAEGAAYSRRNLPHFERPWAKYFITFATRDRQPLSPEERDLTLNALLHFNDDRYELYAACVMPDHVHFLCEPSPESRDSDDNPIFWPLSKFLHSIKSYTANEINKLRNDTGSVWEKESFDRLIRSDSDLKEKFEYICRNPWDNHIVPPEEDYPWLWTRGTHASRVSVPASRRNTPKSPAPKEPDQSTISGEFAFQLYDTYGFPIDLTQLMAAEKGLTVDIAGFESLMNQQRERARAAHTSETVTALDFKTDIVTTFTGYETDSSPTTIHDVLDRDGNTYAIVDTSPLYVEMGGQVGDTGSLSAGDESFNILHVSSVGAATILQLSAMPSSWAGQPLRATVTLDTNRRRDIEKHHTATHILHWALHEIVSPDATQQGSFVGPDRLRFDFSSKALTNKQLQAIENLANEKIKSNDPVTWTQQSYDSVKGNEHIMQFFGDKYGDTVRVVQIGGTKGALDGWSMELCAGTHVRHTGDIEQIIIKKEEAIAAGIRRIEAVCGAHAKAYLEETQATLEKETHQLANKIAALNAQLAAANAPTLESPIVPDPGNRNDLTAYRDTLRRLAVEADKSLKKIQTAKLAKQADTQIDNLIANATGNPPVIIETLDNAGANLLGEFINSLKKKHFKGIAVLVAPEESSQKVHLGIAVHPDLTSQFKAGDLMKKLAPIVGGRGGGKPDFARGAGSDPSKIEDLLAAAHNCF
ncbi:MAG: alanine--tRNA ligase [Verrucomicrobiota bacterium]